MKYDIIPMTVEHIPQVAALERKCFSAPWSERMLREHLDNECAATLVALGEDGTVLGYAGILVVLDEGYITNIAVEPAYRRQGIAAALTARLALECLAQGKVPFYCAAWSNIPSVRNAIRAGFRPAWVELTVKSAETVSGMNA